MNMGKGSGDERMRQGPAVLRTLLPLFLFLTLAAPLTAQEICDNGVDDDGNGLIDLNDLVGCPCDPVVQVPTLITNGSFEEFNCCPEGVSQSPFDYINCATGWVDYLETATADYFNNCDYFPGSVPVPLPGGNAAVGMGIASSPGTSYYEFIAQCLPVQMQGGQSYQFGFQVASVRRFLGTFADITYPINYGPVGLAIYGISSCPTMPYDLGVPANICMTDLGWTEMGQATYTPTTNWETVTFTFTAPFDVQAIAFGPTCPTPTDYTMGNQSWPYFFFDEFILEPIELTIEPQGNICTDDLVLTAVPYDASAAQYQWYLNGVAIVGQTGEQLSASALGLTDGIYQIRASNGSDCVVAANTIEVEWPEPDLSAIPTSGCAPLEVAFTNITITPIGTSLWDLGDGTTANTTDVTHIYSEPGSYDVTLAITSPEGCVKDTLFQDLIQVSAVPAASFMADTLAGCPGLVVAFTNTSLLANGATCTWDMGDGTTLTDCDPVYTYAQPGIYDVRLTVTTPEGCPDDTLANALVTILPVPAPSFSIDPAEGCIPLVVRFDNETPGAATQTADWDLGNGQTSDQTHTIGTYTEPGVYTVSLTMTNTLGCSATLVHLDTITAYPLPEVLFTASPDSGCAPLSVTFQNITDPALTAGCLWEFGDGTTANGCNLVHTYTEPGIYNVSLTVTTPRSCTGDTTLFELITVNPSPTAAFEANPQPTDLFNTEVIFTDRSSPDVIVWSWTFSVGDPGTSSATDPVVMFPFGEVNDYPVMLIVNNDLGCVDTAIAVVSISGLFSVHVPNSFTPNGDGINDLFIPVMRDVMTDGYQLLIFDRWGEEIFTTSDINAGWDGSVKGASPKTDVYVWRLLARSDVDGMRREFRGHVTVLP